MQKISRTARPSGLASESASPDRSGKFTKTQGPVGHYLKSCKIRYQDLISWESLRSAWQAYRSGKRSRADVASFELNADLNLLRQSQALQTAQYRPGAYRILCIQDPKPRLIAVAAVRDRIIHTLLHQQIEPFFNRMLIEDSYACLPGKGCHRAILRYLAFLRQFNYVLHLDIHRYYANIRHDILLAMLHKNLRDPAVLDLLKSILQSGQSLYERQAFRQFFDLPPLPLKAQDRVAQGLPIGNLTSQWWGNLYLNGLDHYIKRQLKVKGYLRYMDDFVLFSNNKTQLKQQRNLLDTWLAQNRNLALKKGKGQIRPTKCVQYWLGHKITLAGYDPGPKAVKRMKNKLKHRINGNEATFERAMHAWRGMVNW